MYKGQERNKGLEQNEVQYSTEQYSGVGNDIVQGPVVQRLDNAIHRIPYSY